MEALAFLDTHVVVWLYGGELGLISKPAQKLIEESSLIVSPMVLLEMDYLYETKRIKTKGGQVFEELHGAIQLELANDPFADIVFQASSLTWTRDPFDRLIIAHAAFRKAPLITKDHLLKRHYRCIW